MKNLISRIGHYVDISGDKFNGLNNLNHRIETCRPGEDIVRVGEKVDSVFVIESGWAIRFRILDDGRRQILNFMLPGDCFDMMAMVKAKSDHAVSAVTKVVLRRISSIDFLSAMSHDASLATAFWWVGVQEESILREQIIRIGRRSAKERVAHLLLELNRRLAAVDGHESDTINLPIPQALLADSLGLSIVHISRTLSKLRAAGYIANNPMGIDILDRKGMAEMADFDSHYLHLDKLKLSN